MDLAIFTTDGLLFLLRWVHFMAGVTWVGLLYYFNFVQVPFFAETDAPVRTGAVVKLVPRALWWFRWAAMFTFLSGITILLVRVGQAGTSILGEAWGIGISTGALAGIIMFLNVWLVIWPNQKVVIASTQAVAGGGQADPKAGPAGARAFLASRTNTVLSIPMLFFMGAASHLPGFLRKGSSGVVAAAVSIACFAALELNALAGKKGAGPSKLLESHVRVIHLGIVATVVLYLVYALV